MFVAAPADMLDRIDDLKLHIDELESELAEASRVAEAAAKRSRRLGERTQQLQSYAVQHVYEGDEGPARAALQQKAAAAEALAKANDRARLNCLLAAKLEQVGVEGCGACEWVLVPAQCVTHLINASAVCESACCRLQYLILPHHSAAGLQHDTGAMACQHSNTLKHAT
jgi:hypothetical protein